MKHNVGGALKKLVQLWSVLHLRLFFQTYKLSCSNSVYSRTSFFLRQVAILVICPFRFFSSSDCCQIHWIITQLLHLLCC